MGGLTVFEVVRTFAERAGERAAIRARQRPALSYAGLLRQIESTVCLLNNAGIRPGRRVAVVLPNGPEMAIAFLAVSSTCTCAPLNPAYRADEFTFFLEDLDASALIVQRGMPCPARSIAEQKGIPIFELVPNMSAASGEFTLEVSSARSAGQSQLPAPDDIALVLHTSGTTSRPKIVPLSHRNLAASAEHIRNALRLTPDDCCLNVMPLFHIHGLIGAVLSSLAAGASVVCTPGFDAPRFFDWMDEFHPTWYTAVPSMHQAILARVPENRERLASSRLRLIRSSSSSLPPQVMAQLEEAFGVPAIESYGMT